MNTQLSQNDEEMHEMRTLFREPQELLNLKEFRKKLRNKQGQAIVARGHWSTWREFNLFEALSRAELIQQTSLPLGYFCPRQDWDEPDELPSPLENSMLLFPRIHSERLSFHRCNPEELEFNRDFGVWQAPVRTEESVPQVLFVPCSAADLFGRRLGRGGGFYDRYLQAHPQVFSIGVLHSDYLFNQLPEDYFHSGDQRIDSLLTESSFHFPLKEPI